MLLEDGFIGGGNTNGGGNNYNIGGGEDSWKDVIKCRKNMLFLKLN